MTSFSLTHNYITKEGEQNILNFKYKGGDESPLMASYYSPVAEKIVEYIIPEWLA